MRVNPLLVSLIFIIAGAAQPVFGDSMDVGLCEIDAAWTYPEVAQTNLLDSLLDPFHGRMNTQIFTDLSPIVDTPEGVKLPDDQRSEE